MRTQEIDDVQVSGVSVREEGVASSSIKQPAYIM